MEPFIGSLLEYGAIGALAAFALYLLYKQQREYRDHLIEDREREELHRQQVEADRRELLDTVKASVETKSNLVNAIQAVLDVIKRER